MPIEADGNVRGVTPVEFRVMPSALRFVVGQITVIMKRTDFHFPYPHFSFFISHRLEPREGIKWQMRDQK